MFEPDFVVGVGDRTDDGRLLTEHVDRISEILGARGFVLLPSDTSYAVAAVLLSERTGQDVNTLLRRRKDEPISLAFSSTDAARRWTARNPIVNTLLDRFMPGPITVVCVPSRNIPDEITTKALASRNRTIGVRVSDSIEERMVAGATGYPVTTVAIRHGGDPVTDFRQAIAIVQAGIGDIGNPRWCAIEGKIRYDVHSTVVEVLGTDPTLRLIRQGFIPFADIQDSLREPTDRT
jgi:L-threonylcarbamoyladenylate synthase